MKVSSIFLAVICCTSSTRMLLGADSPINPQNWISTYMYDSNGALVISQQDLQALLNLLYLSFARSNMTLAAQNDGLQALQTSWQAFQNIIQLRRNPSKELPYSIDKGVYADDMNLLFNDQAEHRRIGTMYAAAVDAIVHGSLITNEQLKKGIQVLRDDARMKIVNELTNVREYLNTILHTRTENANTEPSILNKSFNIGEYVLALIPNLALNSFIKADDLTISISGQWWKALYQLLTISNMIWKPIKHARATLYLPITKQFIVKHNLSKLI